MTARSAPAILFACSVLFAAPAIGQGWAMVDTEGQGGAGAYVCPLDDEATGNFFCFRFECGETEPLRFGIDIAGGASPETLDVTVSVDGRVEGQLDFMRRDAEGYVALTAPYDPRMHRNLVARLRQGVRASLALGFTDEPAEVEMSLRGSSRTLGAVLETCPEPDVPLNDPAAVVLDQITTECAALGGTIAMEPGFERRDDLDGDGRDDVVIDYAAAVCSEMASLYCGSGGCTVGFFLARGEAYKRLFDGVIRGYTVQPGGRLALDLHGTACGLYGFEACRKVFDISGDNFALLEELAGEAAEAAMAAEDAAQAADEDAADDTAEGDDGEETAMSGGADAGAAPIQAETGDATADAGAGEGDELVAPEPDAPVAADAPADDATPAPAPDEAAEADGTETDAVDASDPAPATGLEWIGEGGNVVVPAEGETQPDDLTPDPIGAAPGENPDSGR